MSKEKFCHLHCHNEYSLLDGFGSAKAYVERAKKMGFEYLALTNHANVDGLIKFQRECDKQGVKPVLGCELYIVPDKSIKEKGESRGHITLLVQNETGWQNLCRLLTRANLDGFYYRPRIGYDDLWDLAEGLIIMTGCADSFILKEGGRGMLRDLAREFPKNVFLEVMPHATETQSHLNALCEKLSGQDGIPLVATNDCHYIAPEDWRVQDALLAIQTKAKLTDRDRYRFSFKGLHLRSGEEMAAAFDQIASPSKEARLKAMSNSLLIAEKCSGFRIRKQDIFLPKVPGYERVDSGNYLWGMAYGRLLSLLPKSNPKWNIYLDRLKEEFALIEKKGFLDYFMIVHELVNWCRESEIMIGPGRGSVGGSLLAYLLGITTVDPIRFNLLFSRFIAEDRIDYPDIDIDFEDRKRHLVRSHLEGLYGENNIASISTFLTMKGRMAFRDVCRIYEIPLEEVDPLAKVIGAAEEDEAAIEKAAHDTPEGKLFAKKYPEALELAVKLEGQVRGAGQHAAAIVVSADDLRQGTRGNLARRSDLTVSNWDMNDSEYVGLMKLDVLGLNTLSILSETRRLVRDNHGKQIIFEEIPLDDKAIYKDLSDGNTVGVFQLNTWSGTKMCRETGIENFGLVSDALALVRPGPYDSGMTEDFIKRKHGAKWKKRHPIYEEITRETYGIIVYQEQVMEVISKVAGLPYSTADKIRKIIGKKRDVKEFKPYHDAFIEGCINRKTFSRQEAEEFWEALEKHANYSFNKSHSVEYAMIAYWTAWCKHYYPTEFICASLTYGPESKKEELVNEARRLGLEVSLPRVGLSDSEHWVAKDSILYVPFIEIKGVGDKSATECMTFRPKEKKAPKKKIKGFFNAAPEQAKPEKVGKLEKILTEIGAFGNEPTATRLSDYFTFSIGPRQRFTKLKGLLPKTAEAEELSNILCLDVPSRTIGKGWIVRNTIKDVDSPGTAQCKDCDLSSECRGGPVLPSRGLYNIAICGEAPGKDEDDEGEGFVGKAGNYLWEELAEHDLSRKLFHITNVCKCYPRESRTPSKEHIAKCKHWVEEELAQLDIRLMLAFGNTSLKAFIDKDSGITAKSGTTEWNEKLGLWICWCLHPSAVLHNPNQAKLFSDGISNFAAKIKILGGVSK